MKFYLAPMEGLTGYIYRRAYAHCFGDIDYYFTPFIVNRKMSSKEINDILPEHNPGMNVVPQIMTNKAEDFLEVTKELEEYGYDTVNLNLGCPSGTVVAKKRGAGFLAEPEKLDAFLSEIYEKSTLRISIKTRIGMDDEEEWEELLNIYQKYPIEELIIHPRLQKDFYKNVPRMGAYAKAAERITVPLCYNGDIDSIESYEAFRKAFPKTERMMLGRGVLKNPGLVNTLRRWEESGEKKGTMKADLNPPVLTKEKLRQFHDEIYYGYRSIMSGERNTLFKMKELWSYMGQCFTNPEKYQKKIRKAERLSEYESIVGALFYEQELSNKI